MSPSETLRERAPAPGATIRPEEAAHFGRLAADWWDPKGTSAMLHQLNPVRLGFVRAAIDAHWQGDSRTRHPLAGKRALDVGCGAGLLCEPLARLGADVAGVDAAPENIEAAKAHAAGGGFAIDYRCGEVGALGLSGFDLVTAMEVIEHVADKTAFVAALARALAPGGLMVLSCPNRTARSRLLMVEGAERLGMVPRGTHRWEDFVAPAELRELLAAAGLEMGAPQGIGWSPMKGLHLSEDLALNYLVTARMAG
ncbi:MAG: bifunctional 2-polyprenyl-6-hydroxyphenol methylase/3-demethylubiquinol 3-O-methyltransferase UbiG [Sphingomonadales bacterium]|nr:bifunctional 2-polyprenyl-6-hydroxyphenol methylase/3-demethylubiquinol 3-O-methyltransferase UbiG [Sphingomonadales bacterium]